MTNEARTRRVADHIRVTVAQLLEGRIKDPRLGFVTVTDVRVSGDLQHASVFYTVLGEQTERQASAAALESAKGMIRSQVGKALGIRLTPSLEFIHDALPQNAAALEEAVDAARAHDAKVQALSEGKQYAGDADPYRKMVDGEPD